MYEQYLNRDKLKDFENFLVKVNERTEWQFGLRDTYINDDTVDPALNSQVEYFGFNILQDDRMRYIIENIVTVPTLSMPNKIGNTIISHFYGARGIHGLVTGEPDDKKAHVDFVRIGNGDTEYLDEIKRYIDIGRRQKQKFYGTTELHTSLQTAARNFCRVKYNDSNRQATLVDIIEWIADWTKDGTINRIIDTAGSLKGMFDILTSKPGIGEYYGYHCATSNSVNPYLPFQHDESFCAPGPGARESLENIFDKWSGKKFPYAEMVVWLRDNQERLFERINIHPFFHNYQVADLKVFEHDQNNMKVYGTEVGLCQYGVYCWLKSNPHLISKRKIARVNTVTQSGVCAGATLEDFIK
jgi:hypothetical protein